MCRAKNEDTRTVLKFTYVILKNKRKDLVY
jgi:hypothetical protein